MATELAYKDWLGARAQELADAGNANLESLRGNLKIPVIALNAWGEARAYEIT